MCTIIPFKTLLPNYQHNYFGRFTPFQKFLHLTNYYSYLWLYSAEKLSPYIHSFGPHHCGFTICYDNFLYNFMNLILWFVMTYAILDAQFHLLCAQQADPLEIKYIIYFLISIPSYIHVGTSLGSKGILIQKESNHYYTEYQLNITYPLSLKIMW